MAKSKGGGLTKGKIIFGILLLGMLVTGGIILKNKLKNAADKKNAQDDLTKKADALKASGDIAGAAEVQKDIQAVKNTPAGFPLKRGSVGDDVKTLQSYIMSKYSSNTLGAHGGADGIFGQYTENDVKNLLNISDGQVTEDWFKTFVKGIGLTPTGQSFALGVAYAKADGILVQNNITGDVAFTATKGQRLGNITALGKIQGNDMYIIDGAYRVGTQYVTVSSSFDGFGVTTGLVQRFDSENAFLRG